MNNQPEQDIKQDSNKLVPRMTGQELDMLSSCARKAKVVLEFGAGGSTQVFLDERTEKIYTVESDRKWILKLQSAGDMSRSIETGRWVPMHIGIGPTKGWGFPADDTKKLNWPNYHCKVWPLLESFPDLVFVDGRFRVACTVQALLRMNANTVLLVHDFTGRQHYQCILDHADIIGSADTLVSLRRKASSETGRLLDLLSKAYFDPR